MATERRTTTCIEEQLEEALDAAECPEVRYHIRESMQLLHLDDRES
ncbi:hypothetical protein B4589_007765 [Halolamina sp. CBA1230]|nr:hypothetical protein [Halolamina sp. CBA1230]QKY20280.1 hypothetical protein B4589_007765 [Halolamina sp. CBA1230]